MSDRLRWLGVLLHKPVSTAHPTVPVCTSAAPTACIYHPSRWADETALA
jgi:hypothetical protein